MKGILSRSLLIIFFLSFNYCYDVLYKYPTPHNINPMVSGAYLNLVTGGYGDNGGGPTNKMYPEENEPSYNWDVNIYKNATGDWYLMLPSAVYQGQNSTINLGNVTVDYTNPLSKGTNVGSTARAWSQASFPGVILDSSSGTVKAFALQIRDESDRNNIVFGWVEFKAHPGGAEITAYGYNTVPGATCYYGEIFTTQLITTEDISTGITTGITTKGATTGTTTGITTQGVTTGATTGISVTTGLTTSKVLTTGATTKPLVTTGFTTGFTTGITTILSVTTGLTTGATTGATTGVTTGATTGSTTLGSEGWTTGFTTKPEASTGIITTSHVTTGNNPVTTENILNTTVNLASTNLIPLTTNILSGILPTTDTSTTAMSTSTTGDSEVTYEYTVVTQNISLGVMPRQGCLVCDSETFVCSNETSWNGGDFAMTDPRPNSTWELTGLTFNTDMFWCSQDYSLNINIDQNDIGTLTSNNTVDSNNSTSQCNDICKQDTSVCSDSWTILRNYWNSSSAINMLHLRISGNSSVCISSLSATFTMRIEVPKPIKEDKTTMYIIIGAAGGGGLLLIVVAIIIVVVLLKKRNKRLKYNETNNIEMSSKNIPELSNVIVKSRLGGGNFGDVYLGTWNDTTVALKKLKDEEDMKSFQEEASILFSLHHPNVVQFLGIYEDRSISYRGQYIVLEFMSKGSLKDLLEKEPSMMVEDLCDMVIGACKGMLFLSQKGIVHKDLGVRNLLVSLLNDKYNVKISDFGLAYITEDQWSEMAFPVKWSAPEVLDRKLFSTAADVYSFGIVVWEIFSFGALPYNWMNNRDATDSICNGVLLPKPKDIPEDLWQIVLKCWTFDPKNRPDFSTLLKQIQTSTKTLDKNVKAINYQHNDNSYMKQNYGDPKDNINYESKNGGNGMYNNNNYNNNNNNV